MFNPLIKSRRLEPITNTADTASDFESRLRGAMHPGESILSRIMKPDPKLQTSSNFNMNKTSAPLHLNIAQDDIATMESTSTKTPYETTLLDQLNRNPSIQYTFIESKI
jgi:hypothetical protein